MWLLHKKESQSMREYQVKKREVYDEFANIEKTYYFVREMYCPLYTNRITGDKHVVSDVSWTAHGKYDWANSGGMHPRWRLTEFKTVQEALDYLERLKSGAVYNDSVDTVMETVVI